MASYTAMDQTPDETRLDLRYGRMNWSVRLLGPNAWALYLWCPFTPKDQNHGMWEQTTGFIRAKTYHDAVTRFAH